MILEAEAMYECVTLPVNCVILDAYIGQYNMVHIVYESSDNLKREFKVEVRRVGQPTFAGFKFLAASKYRNGTRVYIYLEDM